MSEAGTQRRARVAPERQLTDPQATDEQLDLLPEDDQQTLTPEQQADEHRRQVEELKRQQESERIARLEAERRAQSMQTQIEAVQKNAETAQQQALDSQIDSQNRLVEQAKMALRSARESGDFDAEERALDSLTDAKAQLTILKQQKATPAPQPVQQPQYQQSSQQMDAYRGPHGYSKASEDWLTNHPRFDTEPYYKTMVLQAAQAAIQSGHTADSPQFFKFMDDVMEKAFPPAQTQQNQQQPSRRLASSMAAPPSRTAAGGARNGADSGDVSVQAQTVAKALGVTINDLEQFAKISKMPLDKYVAEQMTIIDEERRGINTGLYRDRGIS